MAGLLVVVAILTMSGVRLWQQQKVRNAEANAVAMHRLGEEERTRGRFREARDAFAEAVYWRRIRSEDAPKNAKFKRELATSYDWLADIEMALRHLPETRAACEEGLKQRQELLVDGRLMDLEDERGLDNDSECIGDVARLNGDWDVAHESYEKILASRQRRLNMNPASPQCQGDVARSYQRRCELALSQNQCDDAGRLCEWALGFRKSLADSYPRNADFKAGVSDSCRWLGHVDERCGREMVRKHVECE